MADPSPEEAEILGRSIAMLPPQSPSGLSRERALAILSQLVRVLRELGGVRRAPLAGTTLGPHATAPPRRDSGALGTRGHDQVLTPQGRTTSFPIAVDLGSRCTGDVGLL